MLVEHLAQGFSFESFAAIADCHIDTLYNWEKLFPEFSYAKKLGYPKSLYFDEKQLLNIIQGNIKGSLVGQIYKMKCRHRKYWNDEGDVAQLQKQVSKLVLKFKEETEKE